MLFSCSSHSLPSCPPLCLFASFPLLSYRVSLGGESVCCYVLCLCEWFLCICFRVCCCDVEQSHRDLLCVSVVRDALYCLRRMLVSCCLCVSRAVLPVCVVVCLGNQCTNSITLIGTVIGTLLDYSTLCYMYQCKPVTNIANLRPTCCSESHQLNNPPYICLQDPLPSLHSLAAAEPMRILLLPPPTVRHCLLQ